MRWSVLPLVLVLAACGGQVPGKDATGSLAGLVTLEGASDHTGVEVLLTPGDHAARTNAWGQYVLEGLPPGAYSLRAQATGYVSRSTEVTVAAGTTSTVPPLVLSRQSAPPDGGVAGVVTRQGDSSGDGVSLKLTPGDRLAATDATGAYAFKEVPAGTYTLEATAPGYYTRTVQVSVNAGATTQVPTLTLQQIPPPTMTGTVSGRASLASAASSSGVEVVLSELGLRTTTDSRGSYTLDAAPAGTYTLLAQAPGYVSASIPVTVTVGTQVTAPPLVLGPQVTSPAVPSLVLPRGHVTLKGSGFGATRGTGQVRFGTAEAAGYLSWTDTEVRVVAPAALLSGPVDVTVVVGAQEVLRRAVRVIRTSTTLAGGWGHSLALKTDGTVAAWGNNTDGEATVPAGLADVVSIAAPTTEARSLALRADGTVVVWGDNLMGESTVPSGLRDVVAVSAGGRHNLALRSDGTVVAWGQNDDQQAAVPAGLSDVVAVSAGANHSLALRADGTVVAWGRSAVGITAVPAGLSGVTAISAGSAFSLALRADGSLVGWGANDYGQASAPAGLGGVVALKAGNSTSVAAKADGTVVAWGNPYESILPLPTGLTSVVAVTTGYTHGLALRADGTVVAWGRSDNGRTTVPAGLLVRLP